jgi:hypothetical protein
MILDHLQEVRHVIDTASETRVATHYMPWNVNGLTD